MSEKLTQDIEVGNELETKEPVSEERILDLCSLDDQQKEELKVRVEKWNGVVRIFVHPFYEDNGNYRSRQQHKMNLASRNVDRMYKRRDIKEALTLFASKSETETPPVIIFEENRYLNGLMGNLPDPKNKLYMVPTDFEDPTPSKERNLSWDSVGKVLKDAGAKRILISGMYLEKNPDVGNDYSWGCVKSAIDGLQQYADVELSSLSYPQSRADFVNKVYPKNENN